MEVAEDHWLHSMYPISSRERLSADDDDIAVFD